MLKEVDLKSSDWTKLVVKYWNEDETFIIVNLWLDYDIPQVRDICHKCFKGSVITNLLCEMNVIYKYSPIAELNCKNGRNSPIEVVFVPRSAVSYGSDTPDRSVKILNAVWALGSSCLHIMAYFQNVSCEAGLRAAHGLWRKGPLRLDGNCRHQTSA